MLNDSPIPVICGPTAGGKSDLALALARSLRAQGKQAAILAADAFQIYKGLDIASAKPAPHERDGFEHLLIDLVEPAQAFSASDWLRAAREAIDDCLRRNVTPIVVGGTHLYIKLLVEGMFEGPGADAHLRAQLAAMPARALREELERIDPVSAARLHPNDLRRTIRAIEVFRLTGKPISAHQSQWDAPGSRQRAAHQLIILEWPTDLINRRINARVKLMMERGMLDETRALWQQGCLGPQASEALGTKQLVEHLEDRCSLDEALEQVKIQTRRFAKNQRTWLKRLRLTPGAIVLASETHDPPLEAWIARVAGAWSPENAEKT